MVKNEAGKPIYMVASFIDITEREQLRGEIEKEPGEIQGVSRVITTSCF